MKHLLSMYLLILVSHLCFALEPDQIYSSVTLGNSFRLEKILAEKTPEAACAKAKELFPKFSVAKLTYQDGYEGTYLPTARVEYPPECEEVDGEYKFRYKTAIFDDNGEIREQVMHHFMAENTPNSNEVIIRDPDKEQGYVVGKNAVKEAPLSTVVSPGSGPCAEFNTLTQLFNLGDEQERARYQYISDRPIQMRPSQRVNN